MVAEDRQRVIGQRAGGNVEHAGSNSPEILYMLGIIKSRPCEAVNVLVSAPRQGSRAQRRRRRLRTASRHADLLAKEVVAALRGPLVGHFGHGRGRRNGVDCGHIAERVCDVADGGIAVHGHLDAQVEDLLYGVGFQPNDLHGFIIKKQIPQSQGKWRYKRAKACAPRRIFFAAASGICAHAQIKGSRFSIPACMTFKASFSLALRRQSMHIAIF